MGATIKATLDLIACSFLTRLSLDFAVLMFFICIAYPVNGHSLSHNHSLKMSMCIGFMQDPDPNYLHLFMPTPFVLPQKLDDVLIHPLTCTWQACTRCMSDLEASRYINLLPNGDAELFWQSTMESGTDTDKDKSSVLLMTFHLELW